MHNLIGQKRNKLTILEKTNNVGKKTAWIAQCECGNKTVVRTQDLLSTNRRRKVSCGCENFRSGENSAIWKGVGGLSSTYFSRSKQSAKVRNIQFSISIEDAVNKYKQQEGVCILSGQKIELNIDASLDRIDSDKGYLVDNIQWVHKDINRIKSDIKQKYFIEICKLIADYNK